MRVIYSQIISNVVVKSPILQFGVCVNLQKDREGKFNSGWLHTWRSFIIIIVMKLADRQFMHDIDMHTMYRFL